MEFLDEMLELRPTGTNLTPSQESFESQRSLSPGTRQTPSLSPNLMHLPLLKCSQETLPQQSPSQLSTSPPPLSTPNDETKPFLIQTPSLGPDQTSVSTMHLPPLLSSQPIQPQQLPVLILMPSPGPGQAPSISTMHVPPLLQSTQETQPQQLPSEISTSPPSTISDETKPILFQTLNEDTKPISIQMSNDVTKPISIQMSNDETRPISIQMSNDDTKPISIENLSDETKPISIETLSDETKPISIETLSDETKPISIKTLSDETKPISIETLSDETKTIAIETLSDETKPISIETLSDETKPISIETLSDETKPISIETLSDDTKPFSIETLSDETKPISIETPIDKRPHKTKRKNDCNVDDFGLGSTDKVLNYLKIKKQKTEWDSVEYLFMSYAKSFKQLSPRKQVKIKMALANLLVEPEKDESENKSVTLCRELDSYEDHFFEYFHMTRDSFEELHYLVRPYIQKMDTNYRKAIGSRERLAVCLRYIRTGNSFITIAYSFRIGRSTVSMIVDAVSKAIWKCLQPVYMPSPTEEIWKQSELGYQEIWNFPNCVGSLGGKHVMIQCPRNNGSIVLFAVADPFHNFIVIDAGSYGHPGDSNLFDNSAFYNQYLHNKQLLPPKPLPGTSEPVPHVLIGDEVFPLQTFVMRPFPAAASIHDSRKQTFNHRLGHARSVVENAFSSLPEKWRVFQKPLECNVEKAVHVIKAACCLHNFVSIKHGGIIRTFSNETTPSENSGTMCKKLGINAFTSLRPTNIRSPNAAFVIREKFLEYFNRA